MAKFDDFAQMALDMITEYGTDVPFLRRGAAVTDPVTQEITYTPLTATMKAVGMPAGRSAEFRIGKLERRNIHEFYIAQRGQSLTPQPDDEITFASRVWKLIWSTTYDPAADGAIFTLAYGES